MCRGAEEKAIVFFFAEVFAFEPVPSFVGLAINTRDKKDRLNGLFCHTASGAFYIPMARPPGGS